tara:strand:+ start:5751 stop:5990 length:240 start_codon:yes stop_codon:yes gene_type:complete
MTIRLQQSVGGYTDDGLYKVEVNAAGDPVGVYKGNGLRFPTVESAYGYGLDLALRWTAVRDFRVIDLDGNVCELGSPGP